MKAHFGFAINHQNEQKDFENNVLWTDGTEADVFDDTAYIRLKISTVHQHKQFMLNVRHSGGRVIMCIHFT